MLIEANPDINQSRLGEIMGVNRATVMALIDRLVARRLVRRTASATDKRANALSLTEAGVRRLRAASAEVAAHDAGLGRISLRRNSRPCAAC